MLKVMRKGSRSVIYCNTVIEQSPITFSKNKSWIFATDCIMHAVGCVKHVYLLTHVNCYTPDLYRKINYNVLCDLMSLYFLKKHALYRLPVPACKCLAGKCETNNIELALLYPL